MKHFSICCYCLRSRAAPLQIFQIKSNDAVGSCVFRGVKTRMWVKYSSEHDVIFESWTLSHQEALSFLPVSDWKEVFCTMSASFHSKLPVNTGLCAPASFSSSALFFFFLLSSSDERGFADALWVPASEHSWEETEPDVWPWHGGRLDPLCRAKLPCSRVHLWAW